MRERLYAYDRSGNLIPNSIGALERAYDVSWRTRVPGGYEDLTFKVDMPFLRKWDVGLAYKIAAYDGSRLLWVGRIEDQTPEVNLPGDLGRASRQIAAYGYGQNLVQRLFSANYPGGTIYADEIIRAMAMTAVPLIGIGNVQSPLVNLVPISWTNAVAQQVIEQLLKYGDSQTPPRQWLWAVWGEESGSVPVLMSDWHGGASGNDPVDPQWDGKVLNSGTIAMSGSYLRVNTPAATDAALVVTNQPLAYGREFRAEHKCRLHAVTEHLMALIVRPLSTQPVPGAYGYPGTYGEIFLRQSTNGDIHIYYRGSDGLYRSWDGATWQLANTVAYAGARDTWYWFRVSSTTTGWMAQVLDSTGNTALATTVPVSWSDTYGAGEQSIWLAFGDFSTLNIESGYMDSERINIYTPATKPLAYFWPLDLSDYDIQIPLASIKGTIRAPQTLDGVYNAVLASYGSGPSYTTWAEDAASQLAYDRRDRLIEAGNVSLAVAQKARDMALNASKAVQKRLSEFTIIGDVRDRAGARVPLNRIRAGQRAIIAGLDMEPFLIGRTDYKPATDSQPASMSISIAGAPNTVEMFLAQSIKKAGGR